MLEKFLTINYSEYKFCLTNVYRSRLWVSLLTVLTRVSAVILLLVIWIRSKLNPTFFQVNYELSENQSSQMKLP